MQDPAPKESAVQPAALQQEGVGKGPPGASQGWTLVCSRHSLPEYTMAPWDSLRSWCTGAVLARGTWKVNTSMASRARQTCDRGWEGRQDSSSAQAGERSVFEGVQERTAALCYSVQERCRCCWRLLPAHSC